MRRSTISQGLSNPPGWPHHHCASCGRRTYWPSGDHNEATSHRPSRRGRSGRRRRPEASSGGRALRHRRLTRRAKPSRRRAVGYSSVGTRHLSWTRHRLVSTSTRGASGNGSDVCRRGLVRARVLGTTPVPAAWPDAPRGPRGYRQRTGDRSCRKRSNRSPHQLTTAPVSHQDGEAVRHVKTLDTRSQRHCDVRPLKRLDQV